MNSNKLLFTLPVRIIVLFLGIFAVSSVSADAAVCPYPKPKKDIPKFKFVLELAENTISQGFLGTSLQFQVDDDLFWSDPKALPHMSQIGIASLRYPGGEVSDNYDWQNHKVERPDEWPKAATNEEARKLRLDYLELLKHAKALGIKDIFFVVNIDGAFHAPGNRNDNIHRYAKKAASWVKAVKAAGYYVPYWEVGNEPHRKATPLTAKEYANVLSIFSKYMKQADPTIKIGAAGPLGENQVGYGDRIGKKYLDPLRLAGVNIKRSCTKLKRDECIKKLRNGNPPPQNIPKWWPTVLNIAPDAFDFVAVHRYQKLGIKDIETKPVKLFKFSSTLSKFRDYLTTKTQRPVLIALTEWNTANEKRTGVLSPMDHLLEIAVQIGNNAVGGVQYSHLWPFRSPKEYRKTLLNNKTEIRPIGMFYSQLSGLLPGAEVSHSRLGKYIYVLKSHRTKDEGFLVVNTAKSASQVSIKDIIDQNTAVTLINKSGNKKVNFTYQQCSNQGSTAINKWVYLPPLSITIIKTDQ